ncbi:MAG: hypothetical protein ACI8UO_006043 [Verrucomicrobiales bacterium]|jgi:hypothetical protein
MIGKRAWRRWKPITRSQQPQLTAETGEGKYFGYIAELKYDGTLHYVVASPSKLLRMVD